MEIYTSAATGPLEAAQRLRDGFEFTVTHKYLSSEIGFDSIVQTKLLAYLAMPTPENLTAARVALQNQIAGRHDDDA